MKELFLEDYAHLDQDSVKVDICGSYEIDKSDLEDKREEPKDLVEVSVPKFKEGNTVKCISDNYAYVTKGSKYTVLGVDDFANMIFLTTDDGDESWYDIADFVLVNETKVVQENPFEEVEDRISEIIEQVSKVNLSESDLLKSLTASDNCFITFEKGKMIVVDTADYLSYNVNSVEEAIVVAQKIDDLRVIEDELKEFRGE